MQPTAYRAGEGLSHLVRGFPTVGTGLGGKNFDTIPCETESRQGLLSNSLLCVRLFTMILFCMQEFVSKKAGPPSTSQRHPTYANKEGP